MEIGDKEFETAHDLMRRFEAAIGNTGATVDVLCDICVAGGGLALNDALDHMMERMKQGKDVEPGLADRPWDWWAAVAGRSLSSSRPMLAARIFTFLDMFTTLQLSEDEWVEIGMNQPRPHIVVSIAANALLALKDVADDVLVAGNLTGSMTADMVRFWAAFTITQQPERGAQVSDEILQLARTNLPTERS